VCTHSEIALVPTATSVDTVPRARPWIESDEGLTNVPEGVAMTDALNCLAPQGIAGCGFEQPLESMVLALQRTEDPADPAYGFLRARAVLAVVVVSDETDCSHNPDWSQIFSPTENGGNEVFWSSPSDQSEPTSAACWNAGVGCTRGFLGAPYDECHAVDRDVDGFEIVDGDPEVDAVLHPVARYTQRLQSLEQAKQQISPGQDLVFAAISGVPQGYEAGGVEIPYQDANDATFQLEHGIGPGCVGPGGDAVPPVREREVAEALAIGDGTAVYSICAADFASSLRSIGETIATQLKPACMPACVADADPHTSTLEPTCVLTQIAPDHSGGVEEIDVPECLDADGTLPSDTDVCYVAATGDARHPYCAELGFNLEFVLHRRRGVPAPPGAVIAPCCVLSQDRAEDCPDLP
jgi:hypothetical protein